jgi:hypothetical protein
MSERKLFFELPAKRNRPGAKIMKRREMVAILAGVLVGTVTLVAASRAGQQQNNTPLSFTGEIMDGACAVLGSHDQMMKKEGIKTAKDCVLQCVKDGSKLVLFAASNKTAYQLDDQDKSTEFAGEKVTIIGTYDGSTKTIHIQSIQAVP